MTSLDELTLRTRNYIVLEKRKGNKDMMDSQNVSKQVVKALRDMGIYGHILSMKDKESLVFYQLDIHSITNRLTPLFSLDLRGFDVDSLSFQTFCHGKELVK